MPRNKKVGRKGNLKGSFRRPNHGATSKLSSFDGILSTKQAGHNEFTLQDEAQNTARHQSFWDTDQRLRHAKVNFIRGEALEPSKTKPLDSTNRKNAESALADMTLEESSLEIAVDVYEEEPEKRQKEVMPERSKLADNELGFIIDTEGSKPKNTGFSAPQLRDLSPTPSDSSEEVILFGGRDQNGRGLSRVPEISRNQTCSINQRIRVVEDRILAQEQLLEDVIHLKNTRSTTIPFRSTVQDSVQDPPVYSSTSLSTKQNTSSIWENRRNRTQNENDASMADYIANIDGDDILASFAQRELGGTDDELWQDDTEASSEEPEGLAKSPGWDLDDQDFDELSTSDNVMGDIKEVLSKRLRPSGLQYLIVWEGHSIDEAKWVPKLSLSSGNALLHVEKFEAEEQLVTEFMRHNYEDSYDRKNMGDGSDGVEGTNANDDPRHARIRIQQMSDAKIANLLAKQEQLGIGSDEVLLFDDEVGDEDEDDDIDFSNSTFPPVFLHSKPKGGGQRSAQRHDDFPSASLLADAYDGFDIMDFERPSLAKKPKGRRGKLAFDISDSELEESMISAWNKDRVKKKQRKQEREELRAQGLLGSKNGKPDLKQKYKEGIGIHAVKDEIKRFLIGDNTTLALPPMEKADRKVVHELASVFKLKSKSDGSGKKRYPVLYKTQQTRPFLEHSFDAIEARISRRFLPRADIRGKNRNPHTETNRAGGYSRAAVSYRDGDVVGGSAPELGAENRGRAMLEKMGWSTGTALGALNNKGILQPVSHIVKTTKAGLG